MLFQRRQAEERVSVLAFFLSWLLLSHTDASTEMTDCLIDCNIPKHTATANTATGNASSVTLACTDDDDESDESILASVSLVLLLHFVVGPTQQQQPRCTTGLLDSRWGCDERQE